MQKIASIQVLRAIAANMVVLNHIWSIEQKYHPGAGIMPPYFMWSGWHGVYLFFIISGFVIIRASEQEDWRQFIAARVTRIYPPYWFYTAVLLVGYITVPHLLAARPNVSILASFALWPAAERPLLSVGWTLIHEMYFYIVVTMTLAVGLRPLCILLPWAIIIIAAQLFSYDENPVIMILFSPLTLLFIFGAGLGLITRPRVKAKTRKPSFIEKIAVSLGDASYSTYLAHVLVVSAIWRVSFIGTWQAPRWILIAISLIAANVWGLFSYQLIERPLMAAARKLTARTSRLAIIK